MTSVDTDVLIIGEALIDIVETRTGTTEIVGGSPANVALGLGRRGTRVALLTQIADDQHGRMILNHLEESGVYVLPESLVATRTPTATATIGVDGQAQYTFDLQWETLEHLDDTRPRLIHTGSIGAFMEPGASSVRNLLDASESSEITFDPNIRPALLDRRAAVPVFEELTRLSTVVKMSDEDADWLYPDVDLNQVIDQVLSLGTRLAVITRGATGAVLATQHDRIHMGAESVTVVDTIGAGDSFMSSLILSILEVGSSDLKKQDLVTMGKAASRVAAITVSRAGADLPWAHEIT